MDPFYSWLHIHTLRTGICFSTIMGTIAQCSNYLMYGPSLIWTWHTYPTYRYLFSTIKGTIAQCSNYLIHVYRPFLLLTWHKCHIHTGMCFSTFKSTTAQQSNYLGLTETFLRCNRIHTSHTGICTGTLINRTTVQKNNCLRYSAFLPWV